MERVNWTTPTCARGKSEWAPCSGSAECAATGRFCAQVEQDDLPSNRPGQAWYILENLVKCEHPVTPARPTRPSETGCCQK